jgi:Transposase-associated domain
MDRNRWTYESGRDTIEYLRGVEEFMDYAIEDMSKKSDKIILYPCRDCQNLRRF